MVTAADLPRFDHEKWDRYVERVESYRARLYVQVLRGLGHCLWWDLYWLGPSATKLVERLEAMTGEQIAQLNEAATQPLDDDEQFCPNCFAGLESSEHHVECGGDES